MNNLNHPNQMETAEQNAVQNVPAVKKRKKKLTVGRVIRTFFDVLVYVVIGAMLVVAAGLMISKAQGKTFFMGGKSIMWIMTGSMEETIPAQSYVLMEKVTDPDTLEVGDVICFHSDDPDLARLSTDLVVHRIVEIIEPEDSATGKREFRSRGDANYMTDRYTVKADKVVARHVKNLPMLSFVGRLLASPYGLVMLSIIIVAAVCTVYIPDLKRRLEQQAAENAEVEAEARKAEMDRLIAAEVEKMKQSAQAQPEQPEQEEQMDSAQPEQDEQPDDAPKSE